MASNPEFTFIAVAVDNIQVTTNIKPDHIITCNGINGTRYTLTLKWSGADITIEFNTVEDRNEHLKANNLTVTGEI